mgnify:CR=1 FL=1
MKKRVKGINIQIKRRDLYLLADIIVFTSPSNVEAWFETYTFQKNQKAIAMGDATANTLRQQKIIPAAQPDTFDDTGLARAVFGASTGF